MQVSTEPAGNISCSFCGKARNEVQKLIAGPKVYICNECVHLCSDILAEGVAASFPHVSHADVVERALREQVIGQEPAVRAIVGALRQHMVGGLESTHPSGVVLLAGPSGCGKTFLAERLAATLELPTFIGDINRVTATGYVGEDIEGFLWELRRRSTAKEVAQRGVLMMDNLEHLEPKQPTPTITRDVTGIEVQRAILRIVEGRDCAIWGRGTRHPQTDADGFQTRGILRVLMVQTERAVDPKDIRAYLRQRGMTGALLSRIPVIISMNSLNREDLREVLTREKTGLVARASTFLQAAHVALPLGLEVTERIVERALQEGDGSWSISRQVSAIVHDIAARNASGRVLFGVEDLERVYPFRPNASP